MLCFSILVPEISLTLDSGSYTFNVSAFTSKGFGDPATFRMNVEKNSMAKDI